MKECCDAAMRVKEITKKEFEIETADITAFVDTVDEKLNSLITDLRDSYLILNTLIEQQLALLPEQRMCDHQFVKQVEPLLKAGTHALLFVQLMSNYQDRNKFAQEQILKILEEITNLCGGSERAHSIIKSMQKKDKKFWFF